MGYGGIAYNCDDCIIAIEMKRIVKKKIFLEKRKKSKTTREKQIDDAKNFLKERGNPLRNWKFPDLTNMIRYEQPKIVLSSKPGSQLETIYNTI